MRFNIFGIDKSVLLLSLYNNAKQQGVAYDNMPAAKHIGLLLKHGKLENAEALLEYRMESDNYYFDYINLGSGPKVIQVDLGVHEPDFSKYDFHHGEGLAKKIVSTLRDKYIEAMTQSQKVNPSFTLAPVLRYMIKVKEAEQNGSKTSNVDNPGIKKASSKL